MKKYLISFVQVNFSVGPKEKNAYYLPYSIGVLWEYAKTKSLDQKFKLDKVIWRRDPLELVLEQIQNSDYICFSNYIWNKSYNYSLAKKIKELNPNKLIIFGGPETPVAKKNIFLEHPYIDIVIKKEGELVFVNLLEKIHLFPEINIPGLLFNLQGEAFDTGESERINELDSIPSPYLSGFFNQIMKDNPTVEWNMTLETDRGCPYACTFCDWGSLTYNKVRKFNLIRVFEELEWAGKNKIGFISMTNANFGMFAERDNLIADKILEVQEKYKFPYTFSTAWAKNQKKDVIAIVKKLINSKSGFNQGLTVSMQSMDDRVLSSIKRKNMAISNIEEVFKECAEQNIPLYTELILGLPNENLATWKENFYKLFKLGNHNGITVFQAQLLENAEMNLLQRSIYGIKSATVYDYMEGNENDGELKEGVDVVISTKDMNYEDMLDAQVWSWFITTFHINGISSFLARFLFKYLNIDYVVFYEKLYEYIDNFEWWKNEKNEIRFYFNQWMQEGEIDHPRVEGVKILGWNLIYRSTAKIMDEDRYDYTSNMLSEFLIKYFKIDSDLRSELIYFQKSYFIRYDELKEYPKYISFKFDFLGYLQGDNNFERSVTYEFDFPDDKEMSKSVFIKYLYFFRRRNFGKAWINTVDSPLRKPKALY